jgi:hypothetical protein
VPFTRRDARAAEREGPSDPSWANPNGYIRPLAGLLYQIESGDDETQGVPALAALRRRGYIKTRMAALSRLGPAIACRDAAR